MRAVKIRGGQIVAWGGEVGGTMTRYNQPTQQCYELISKLPSLYDVSRILKSKELLEGKFNLEHPIFQGNSVFSISVYTVHAI